MLNGITSITDFKYRTMKLLFSILTMLLAVITTVSAQDTYRPFVEEGKEWICAEGTVQERYRLEGGHDSVWPLVQEDVLQLVA